MEHAKIRSSLQSYIKGVATSPQRQNDAVQKMLFLEPQQFDELLADVHEEVNRRSSEPRTPVEKISTYGAKRNASRAKLGNLPEEKFKNLVLDVYLVFNHRYPDFEDKNVDEIEELIGDLEKLITNLKGDMAYEELIIEQLKNEDDYKARHHIFNKYVRRTFEKLNENTSVIDYMETKSKETTHEKIDISDLLETHVFMRHADHYFKYHNLFSDEYEYHKNNLFALKDEEIFEKQTQDRIVRKTKARIFEIMLQTRDKMVKEDVNIEDEVNNIIYSLEKIKDVIRSNDMDTCKEIGDGVLESSGSFLDKVKALKVDDEKIAKLEMERSGLSLIISKEQYEQIPDSIFNLATLVKNILYTLPTR